MTLILQTLYIVLAFGAILFLVYITTKYLGGRAKKTMKGQYVNIVETVNLGMDKQIHLVKAGDQFVLIASAGKSITYLTNIKLDSDEIEEALDKNSSTFDFKGLFEKYLKNFKNKKNEKTAPNKENNDSELENYAGGDAFKVNLSKLRAITSRTSKMDDKGRGYDTDDK
ncbi:MAG: flagellar biosynthetic protein FliO [Bacillota bacterium]|nr:flagellar biosynthetic protein FliO [Bacillota bacterium]